MRKIFVCMLFFVGCAADNSDRDFYRMGYVSGLRSREFYKKSLLMWANEKQVYVDVDAIDSIYHSECPDCFTLAQNDSLLTLIRKEKQ